MEDLRNLMDVIPKEVFTASKLVAIVIYLLLSWVNLDLLWPVDMFTKWTAPGRFVLIFFYGCMVCVATILLGVIDD